MGRLCGLAAAGVRPGLGALMLGAVLGTCFLSASGSAGAESPEGFETKVEAAFEAADAALASEEERLDELAARHSRRALADGRPSLGQAAANIRLWERQIRKLEGGERGLREELRGLLGSLGPDIAELARRLSDQRERAAGEKAERERQERLAREQAAREKAERARKERLAREKVKREKAERERRERAEREEVERRTREFRPGRVFRDCAECPEMLVIPAGSFMMGSPAEEQGRRAFEGPVHRVTVTAPFAVGKYEVTFEEWDACVSGGGCNGYHPNGEGWGRARRPVTNVSWEDAKIYVKWLSGKTRKGYRLLSEAEWEYAARAGTTGPFHFGETISTDQANYNGHYTYGSGRKGVDRSRTVPVGSFPANGFGLHDVHGNVREWVEDCWQEDYSGAPTDGSARLSGGTCKWAVLRGGSWVEGPTSLRSAHRHVVGVGLRNYLSGFRVARTLAR